MYIYVCTYINKYIHIYICMHICIYVCDRGLSAVRGELGWMCSGTWDTVPDLGLYTILPLPILYGV